MTSSDPLIGAGLSYTDVRQSTSCHFIIVIFQSLSVQPAGWLPHNLTHSPGDAVFGQCTVTEDPDVLYLMRLPKDAPSTMTIV